MVLWTEYPAFPCRLSRGQIRAFGGVALPAHESGFGPAKDALWGGRARNTLQMLSLSVGRVVALPH